MLGNLFTHLLQILKLTFQFSARIFFIAQLFLQIWNHCPIRTTRNHWHHLNRLLRLFSLLFRLLRFLLLLQHLTDLFKLLFIQLIYNGQDLASVLFSLLGQISDLIDWLCNWLFFSPGRSTSHGHTALTFALLTGIGVATVAWSLWVCIGLRLLKVAEVGLWKSLRLLIRQLFNSLVETIILFCSKLVGLALCRHYTVCAPSWRSTKLRFYFRHSRLVVDSLGQGTSVGIMKNACTLP